MCIFECSKTIRSKGQFKNFKFSISLFSSFRSSLYERLCRFFVRKGAGGGVAVSSSVVETSTPVNVVTVNGSVKGPNRANPNTVLVKEKKAAMQLGISINYIQDTHCQGSEFKKRYLFKGNELIFFAVSFDLRLTGTLLGTLVNGFHSPSQNP